MRETTWKQDALSRPLERDKARETDTLLNPDIWREYTDSVQVRQILPGGLIKEHDRRIVDQLERDGQSFTLTSGETAGACLSTFQETQSGQDLIHLRNKQGDDAHR